MQQDNEVWAAIRNRTTGPARRARSSEMIERRVAFAIVHPASHSYCYAL